MGNGPRIRPTVARRHGLGGRRQCRSRDCGYRGAARPLGAEQRTLEGARRGNGRRRRTARQLDPSRGRTRPGGARGTVSRRRSRAHPKWDRARCQRLHPRASDASIRSDAAPSRSLRRSRAGHAAAPPITPKGLAQKKYIEAIRTHDLTFCIGQPARARRTWRWRWR